jgi:uncharacterized protein
MSEPADSEGAAGLAGGLVAFVHRHSLLLLAGLVIVTVGLGAMATRISVDNSLRVWFVEGDPALVAYDRYKETFGNDEIIVVAATDPESVYTPAALERIRAASKALEAHPKVRRVNSLALGLYVEGDDGVIEVDRLLGDDPITAEDAARVRARVEADPSFRGTIVGERDTISLILVEPSTAEDFDAERPALMRDVRAIVDDTLRKDGGGAHLGGIGVVYDGLNEASLRDSGVFVTLSYLVVMFGLWVVFRRLIWVLLGVVIATIPVVITLGIAGLAGRDLNMVNAVLPTLIMTVGILDLVHLVHSYGDGHGARPELERRRLLVGSLAVVVVPCVVNTFTDMIGFLALVSAPMSAIRDLGWMAAVGLLALLVTVMIIGIPAIARYGVPKRKRPARELGLVRALVMGLFGVARRRRVAVLGATAVILAVSVVGISRIVVDTYSIGFLPSDHPVRADHRAIEDQFGLYIPLEITVEGTGDDALKDPELLRRVDRMQRAFEEHPEVARVTGITEVIKRVNQLMFDDDPEAYVIPNDARVIAQELFLYESDAAGRDHLDSLVDTRAYRITHVTARTGLPTARGIEAVITDLRARGAEIIGDAGEVEAAGYLPLYVRIIQHVTQAQVRSFSLAFVLVTLVFMLLLRSVKLGLVAMVPNVLPALMTLGFMGFVGIRLDVATVVIAAIAIGISVNDTSHIMFRYKHELARDPTDPVGALERMLLGAGRPLVASSLILMVGFGVLVFASVKSVAYMGLLSATTIAFALVADLLITPALLLFLSREQDG